MNFNVNLKNRFYGVLEVTPKGLNLEDIILRSTVLAIALSNVIT